MSNVRTQVGKLLIDGAEYAVLLRSEGDPAEGAPISYPDIKGSKGTMLISRVFSHYENREGIETLVKVYAPPHWATVIGNTIVHWNNVPVAIEVKNDLEWEQ